MHIHKNCIISGCVLVPGPEDSAGHGPESKVNGHAENSDYKKPQKLNENRNINNLSSPPVNGKA